VPEDNIRKYIQDNFGQLFKTLTDTYEDDLPRFGLCLKKERFPRKTWWKNDSPVDEAVEGFLRQCEKFAKAEQVIRAFKVLVNDVQGNEVLVNALRYFEEAVEKAPAGGQRKQQGEEGKKGSIGAQELQIKQKKDKKDDDYGYVEQPVLEFYIKPGNASAETIQEVLNSLSEYHRATGGLGFEFKSAGHSMLACEEIRV